MNKDLKLVVNNSFIKKENKLFFEKKELKNILDLYAKMVSKGSWKDYGLHISSKRVSFSVFRNAAENDDITYEAYVSEQNLIRDDSGDPIKHPLFNEIFSGKKGSTYFKPSN